MDVSDRPVELPLTALPRSAATSRPWLRIGAPIHEQAKPLSSRSLDRMRAEQVSALYRNVTVGVIGATGGGAVLAGTLIHSGTLALGTGLTWIGYIAACAALHIGLRFAYWRAQPPEADWRIWGAWFTLLSMAEGLGWGWGSVRLVAGDRLDLQLTTFVVCFGIAAGAVPAFGSFLPAFWAIFLGIAIPSTAWTIEAAFVQPQAATLLMLIIIFILAMGALGVKTNQNFKFLVALRLHANDLADDLRYQKEIAEQANLAKSTFLAAASHDLRQPVHALGLFVGALRGIALPPEGRRLVEQIEASTLALDGLFGAILDISRLDAGVVEVQPQAFSIQPMLDRICLDYRAEALAKGVGIRTRPTVARVTTDPILMERILRNLVSNAVRYTARGRIVLGCRRGGSSLTVQVWDTGPGIPADQQERVFQEYFQLQNPERDRTKGLGLGLAIVKRLALLLGCDIRLRSQSGRGSCFSVTMPLAAGAGELAELTVEPQSAGGERKLILVIDDERAIQDAMAALLAGWGHDAIVAGSGDEMLASLATCPVRPNLIICDYRLRAGENGIEVIEMLRSEYNETIPAMLITGDTAADRLLEAQASGLLLLHKPVPNGKLRSAITRLVAAPRTDDSAAA